MSQTIRISGIGMISVAIKAITDALLAFGEINIRITKASRTLDQNALYWKWMECMSRYFTERGRPLDKDEAHDLMRHLFLGYQTKTIGHTEITNLRSTTKLDKGEMSHYMTLIDAWAVDRGCYLPKPEDSEYMELMRQTQEAA